MSTAVSSSAETEAPIAPPKATRTDQNDLYGLKVESKYVLTERPSTLPPIPKVESDTQNDAPPEDDNREKNEDDGTHNNNRGKNTNNRYKKNNRKQRGMNKKRPRDARIGSNDKMCLMILRGEECPYGAEKCRYNHDLKEFLANRTEDIKEVESGCPNYNLRGHCQFGVMCRLGSVHINMSTGQNLTRETTEGSDEPPPPKPVVNLLRKEVQTQLRKKTYPFVCKRHFEVQGDGRGGKGKKRDSDGGKKMEGDGKGDGGNVAKVEPSDGEIVAATKGGEAEKGASPLDPSLDLSTPLPIKRKLIDFRNKVYVAPLTTVGNLPFRRVMKKFGADITCGEMAVASHLLEGKPSEWALLKRHPSEDVFGIQIASGFADQFTRVSELLEAECTMDFVDFNLGCPIDLICNKGAGAALMLRDSKLKSCLEGVTSTLSCPVTVKMRTGWDEGKPFAHRLVSKIQSWGIDGLAAIMIHGRSRLQRYQKEAKWDYIEQVAQSQDPNLPTIPVIGNGDIFSYTDYEEKIAREGVSKTAMIARGALIKPWLPTEIKEQRHWDISASERMDILKDFVKFGLEHWGSDQQGVNNTRRFLLEWLSFLYRYVPVGMLEVVPQQMNQRPPSYMCGRNDLETLMLSPNCADWIKLSEMLLGPVPDGFQFEPKHKANGYK